MLVRESRRILNQHCCRTHRCSLEEGNLQRLLLGDEGQSASDETNMSEMDIVAGSQSTECGTEEVGQDSN